MSAQGTLTARVVTDRDLREQVTGEGPWGLIRNFEAVEISLTLPSQSTNSERFGLIRFEPDAVFVERATQDGSLPQMNVRFGFPDASLFSALLLFVKAHNKREATNPAGISYSGHLVVSTDQPLTDHLDMLCTLTGLNHRREDLVAYLERDANGAASSQPSCLRQLQLTASPHELHLYAGDILVLAHKAVDEMEHVVQEATRSQRELQEKQAECDRLQQEVRRTREESDRLREQLDSREAELHTLQADANAVALQLEELSVAEEQAQAREAARVELQQQLLEMEGDRTACSNLSSAQLEALLRKVEASAAQLRQLLLERRVQEARQEAQAEANECDICASAPKDTRLDPCGHVELVLPLPETARLQDVRRLSAERLGAPPQGLRFWRWAQRMNGTYRPYASVTDGVALSALIRRGSDPPAVDLLLERAAPGAALLPYNPATDLMVFVKALTGAAVPEPIKYMGHVVLRSTQPLRAQLPQLRRVAGMLGGGEVEIHEVQLPQSPAEPGPATSSATERIGQLLEQAAQEAGRAVLERAQLQQQLDEATARAEQGALQVATLRKQLAVRDAQLQRLSDRQQQEAANASSSSGGAEQVTPQQRSQLLVLEGDDAACRALPVAELQALHDQLEASTARLRRLLVDRRVEEAQAEAHARVTECSVCISAAKDTRLSPCGHLLCRQCSLRVAHCPVCRQAVAGRERAFL
ncbi:hypothetical protein ABPG77_011217 [Micractinium sp. CCAP 211/92]